MSADDGKPIDQVGLDGAILERMAPKRFEAGAIHGTDRAMLTGIAERLLKLAPTGRPDEADSYMEVEARQYLDPEIFAHEKRAIFDITPIVAGFSCDVAKPGDYMKVEGLQSPVFITRTKAGVVKAYVNVAPRLCMTIAARRVTVSPAPITAEPMTATASYLACRARRPLKASTRRNTA